MLNFIYFNIIKINRPGGREVEKHSGLCSLHLHYAAGSWALSPRLICPNYHRFIVPVLYIARV
jgi:hypothetical protein